MGLHLSNVTHRARAWLAAGTPKTRGLFAFERRSKAATFDMTPTDRAPFRFSYHDPLGRDSCELVQTLAAELERLGIAHRHFGALTMRDGGTEWRIEPEAGTSRIAGWVRADDPGERQNAIDALGDFLSGDLGITLIAGPVTPR